MAATVLKSQRAIEMSLFIIRAFVKIRQSLAEHRELALKIAEIESQLTEHDAQIGVLISAIKELLSPDPIPPKRRIGFKVGND